LRPKVNTVHGNFSGKIYHHSFCAALYSCEVFIRCVLIMLLLSVYCCGGIFALLSCVSWTVSVNTSSALYCIEVT